MADFPEPFRASVESSSGEAWPVLNFPTDRPRPARLFRAAAQSSELSGELVEAIHCLVAPAGESDEFALQAHLLAVYAVLLNRYSGDEEITIGLARQWTPVPEISGGHAEPGRATFPLCINLTGEPTFEMVWKQIGRGCRRLHDNLRRPADSTSSGLHLGHCPANDQHFQFTFELLPTTMIGREHKVAGNEEVVPQVAARSENELALRIDTRHQGLEFTFVYNAELFDAATVCRLLLHFRTLLESALTHPGERISDLTLITEGERHQLIQEWSRPGTPVQAPAPWSPFNHERFADRASQIPDAVAIVCNGRKLTYRELDDRANQLAHALVRRGAGPDVIVAISLERSLELVIGILGILKAGAAFLPIEPSYPAERISALLAELRPSLLVTDSPLLERCRPCVVDTVCMDTDREAIATESSVAPEVRLNENNTAMVLFTSGSTGMPRAVPHSHKIAGRGNRLSAAIGSTESDRHVLKTSLDSTLLSREVFRPLTNGGCIIVAGQHERTDARALVRLIIDQKITVLTLVPSLLRLLVAEDDFVACTSLREVTCFGEQLSADVENQFCQKVSANLNSVYGCTEAPGLAIRQCRADGPRSLGNLGYRHGNAEIYVLDRRLQPVPIDVPGELYAGGPSLAEGYANGGRETDERFIPHPFCQTKGARLYRTGDRVRWRADGSLEFLGRLDQQIKIRGYRIEAAEVESALARHPAIRDVAVAARPNAVGENQLIALLELRTEGLTSTALRAHLKERLPDQMIPSAFAILTRLPRTPNGKLDRRALPVSDLELLRSAEPYIAPRTAVEERLAGIWCTVLGVNAPGLNDNFFDLGGNSLLATRLLAQVKEVLGVDLNPAVLLHAPTIGQLAATVLRPDWSPSRVIVKLQSGEHAAPFICFPGAYGKSRMVLGHGVVLAALSRQIGPGYPFYGVTLGSLGEEQVDPSTLIEFVAGLALAEIRALRPHGPYLLGGYSLGGLVALEVARRLQAEGEKVPLLAFLDVAGPGYPRQRRRSERIRWHLAEMRGLSAAARARYIAEKVRSSLMAHRDSNPVEPPDAGDIADMIRIATKSYLKGLDKYPGRIHLFRTSGIPPSAGLACDDLTNGWGKIATGGVEVAHVPGDHMSMLEPPHLHGLAEALRSSIQAACS